MKDIVRDTYINLLTNEQTLSYLVKRHPWANDYCYYYLYVLYARREIIEKLLDSIIDDDKNKATLEKAYHYLAKFEQQQLKLATIIPTCNRAKSIKYLLEVTALGHRRRGVDIIIYDSSSNEIGRAHV